jgi:hypothetical protein
MSLEGAAKIDSIFCCHKKYGKSAKKLSRQKRQCEKLKEAQTCTCVSLQTCS